MSAPGTVKARQVPQRSIGGRIVRTGFVAILLVGLGGGARFGYDYYEHGRSGETAETERLDSQAGFLPAIGSGLPSVEASAVSGRYVDVAVAFDASEVADAGQTYTTRWRYSLVTSNLTLEYQGADGAYELDVRNDRFLVRNAGQQFWVNGSDEPTITAVPEGLSALHGFVPMFHDLVPIEAFPYVSVTAETDEQLDVVPLDPPVEMPVDASDSGLVTSGNSDPMLDDVIDFTTPGQSPAARPTGPVAVRHYTLSFDEAAFAAAAPFAHAEWVAAGWWSEENLDLWVDDIGVVRKIVNVDDTGTSTITIHDVADQFPDFQNEVLVTSVVPVLGD